MSGKFDPYYRWLGIPPKEQPPNHYRLLGIELFESDPQLIDSFALRHTSFLREITDGPHLKDAQQLLNELAAARRCLLNPERKVAYDAQLRERLAARNGRPMEDGAGKFSGSEPAADALAANRPILPAGAPPVIAVSPRDESQTSAPGKSQPRSKTASPRPTSGGGSQRVRSSNRKPASPAFRNRVTRMVSSCAGWFPERGDKRLVWILVGSIGLLLVGFGIGAAVLMRGKPPRPAVAAGPARTEPERPPIPEVADAMVTGQKPVAAPLPALRPEPPAGPATRDPPAAVLAEPPDNDPGATAARIAESENLPVPGGFVPDGQAPRLSGLLLWLDASELSAVGGRIARWSDAGGGIYVAQAKQAGQQPEVFAEALGGKSVARFRGGQWLEISGTSQAFNLGSEYTIAYVARGVAGTLLAKGVGDKAGQFALQSDSCFLTNGELNASHGGRLSATDDDPTAFRVRTVVADASALNWFLDGTAGGSYAGERYEIQNKSVLRIGCPAFRAGQEAATPFFVGDLAELLMYNRALPEAERSGVETYLREKWLSGDVPPAPLDLVPPPVTPPAAPAAGRQEPSMPGDDAPSPDQPAEEPTEPSPDGGQAAEPARSELFHLFVNLGGGAWEDPAGNSWVPSKKFDGATFGHEAGQAIKSDAVEHPMYSTAVRGLIGFRAIVPNGDYALELHFHEHWSRNPTDRAFLVALEQIPVLRPPLFFQGPGMGQPYVHKIAKITVKDGRLDVDFSGVQPGSLAILNGIVIRQLR